MIKPSVSCTIPKAILQMEIIIAKFHEAAGALNRELY
jgi:hypothetical protein